MELLDCRGLVCPEPVLRTRALLEKKPADVEVLVDNAPAGGALVTVMLPVETQ